MNATSLAPGLVCWAYLDPAVGREQSGRRPVLVVSNHDYLDVIAALVIVMPITSQHRGWSNHVAVDPPTLLDRPSWVMTEQVRTISRNRVQSPIGLVSPECVAEVRLWLRDFTA